MSPSVTRPGVRTPICVGRAAAALVALGLALGPALPRAESIPERLGRLEARIAALEASARPSAGARSSPDPEAPHAAGEDSLRSQDLLRERRSEAASELARANTEMRKAGRRLSELSAAMSLRLVVMYKTRRAGALPAFSPAQDLQSGLRLASDLDRIAASDARLFEQHRERIRDLEARAARRDALSLRVENADLAYERQRRIDARNALELRRQRVQRSLRLAAELRVVAKALEDRLRGEPRVPAMSPARQGSLGRPVAGPVLARFGARLIPEFADVPRRNGIVIGAARGTPVRAVAAGRVLFADALRGHGQLVILEHVAGLVSVSGDLEQRSVAVGQHLEAGEILGTVGAAHSSEGAGLYFELREDGSPVDPEPWLERASP